MTWSPELGAVADDGGTRFTVWAPSARTVDLVLLQEGGERRLALRRTTEGRFSLHVPEVRAGARYRLALDGGSPFPDPASRFQPEGVHGPSEVIDPRAHAWTDAAWRGLPRRDPVVHEIHVGTFSPEGTFAGVEARLPDLAELGVDAIELMPVADFPGSRNWGYDDAALFAPARCYGRPDDFRRLVDRAHALGLGVFLDVVYNHFGPDGAYAVAFAPEFLTDRHESPWGKGVNLDGPESAGVRGFFIENALHWIHEYHIDGLRLDATHAMADDGPTHFLAELADRVRTTPRGRGVLLVAEDSRNLACMITPRAQEGWGMDGVWADDLHHVIRRLLAGDHEGYYTDYRGTTEELATTLRGGWLFRGERSEYMDGPRGTDPSGREPRQFTVCIQNHDQVGNRALGERLHHQVDHATWRAASALLLCAPQSPLLFMGQEWAATSPFLFFTDHEPGLGKLVTEGRRKEFRHFSAFAAESARERIPDPQAQATFERSRLRWAERDSEPHASVLRLYRALLGLRRAERALQEARDGQHDAWAAGPDVVCLRRRAAEGPGLLLVVRLRGAGAVDLGATLADRSIGARRLSLVLTTEDRRFAPDPMPPSFEATGQTPLVRFARPSALLLRDG